MEESSPNVHGVGCWLNERVDLVKFRAVMQYLAHHHSSLAIVEENGSTSVFFAGGSFFFLIDWADRYSPGKYVSQMVQRSSDGALN